MIKFIEVTVGDQIDRYKYINVSVDDFIDVLAAAKVIKDVKDISESEYEGKKRFELQFNVEDKFQVEHYVIKHPSKEDRNKWNRMIRQMRREEELTERH